MKDMRSSQDTNSITQIPIMLVLMIMLMSMGVKTRSWELNNPHARARDMDLQCLYSSLFSLENEHWASSSAISKCKWARLNGMPPFKLKFGVVYLREKTETKTKTKNQVQTEINIDKLRNRSEIKRSENCGEKVCHVCPGNFCCCNSNYKIREMCALAKFHQIIYLNAEQWAMC